MASTNGSANSWKAIPDIIRIFIQLAGLLVACGVIYQSVQDTKNKVSIMSVQQENLVRDFMNFQIRTETNNADIQARLRAIEERLRLSDRR